MAEGGIQSLVCEIYAKSGLRGDRVPTQEPSRQKVSWVSVGESHARRDRETISFQPRS